VTEKSTVDAQRAREDRRRSALGSGVGWESALGEAIEDIGYCRRSIDEIPAARSHADRKRESEDPHHPEYPANSRVRIDAAEYIYQLALLAAGKEYAVDIHLVGFPCDRQQVRNHLSAPQVLDELHKSLFDRDAAVRLTIVETLALLARPESVSCLEHLEKTEDEGALMRDRIPKALECCRTQSGRDLRGRV
jgi:hypothetical protein